MLSIMHNFYELIKQLNTNREQKRFLLSLNLTTLRGKLSSKIQNWLDDEHESKY